MFDLDEVDRLITIGKSNSGVVPVKDVNETGLLVSLAINTVVFIALTLAYELGRRKLPNIYANKYQREEERRRRLENETGTTNWVPLGWIGPVFDISWKRILKEGGLDAYMYLRYLRVCFLLTSVTAIWALIILWPVYGTGTNDTVGFYRFTMVNISDHDKWRFWFPTVFMYLFTLYFFYLLQMELENFVLLHLDFLGKGQAGVHPQHRYSLMVEGIPEELRSDNALFQYFNRLYPGKVHSARVVVSLSDLNKISAKRQQLTRRLEKCITYGEATGERAIHLVGRKRCTCCNVECCICFCGVCCKRREIVDIDDFSDDECIPKGTKIDAIDYYTRELRITNEKFLKIQKERNEGAETGNISIVADNWFTAVSSATGSVNEFFAFKRFHRPSNPRQSTESNPSNTPGEEHHEDEASTSQTPLTGSENPDSMDKKAPLLENDHLEEDSSEPATSPVTENESEKKGFLHNLQMFTGLDFFGSKAKDVSENVQHIAGVGVTDLSSMSSTGFVTFLDLVSVTGAVNAPLTHKPALLKCKTATERRDIYWNNAHFPYEDQEYRISIADLAVGFGAILWSIPVSFIQALANVDKLSEIPALSWLKKVFTGNLKLLINTYLPVVSMLGIMILLPMIFESISINFERRKSISEIQRSVVIRYFYYQLANVYIMITASSIWSSLSQVIDHPSSIFSLLGHALPRVVGYFASTLLTKTLAGLPLVILRFGSVLRYSILRMSFKPELLSQRELDEVYRQERFYYGWDYPNQLFVLVVCFAYVCIAPMLLIFGAIYFAVALIVYKKQILFVYVPEYESGGSLFPIACTKSIIGLFLGQITFIGYLVIRKCYWQVGLTVPSLFLTYWFRKKIYENYIDNSTLTMERASEADAFNENAPVSLVSTHENEEMPDDIVRPQDLFRKSYYRQPILSEDFRTLLPYRRGQEDELTLIAMTKLGYIDEETVEEQTRSSPDISAATESKPEGNEETKDS